MSEANLNSVFLPEEGATISLGRRIASHLKAGDIVKFTGPLGAGKTTLVRGIVEGLGGNPDQVHSPTFALIHEYECPTFLINHCDFYRLGPQEDLSAFGGQEFFDDVKLYLIEWPPQSRLLESITSRPLIDVRLEYDAMGRRVFLPASWRILD